MKTNRPIPNAFLTRTLSLPLPLRTQPPPSPHPSSHPPPTTLAHIYANLHATNNDNDTMLSSSGAGARPPLAHTRLGSGGGGLHEELHAQYSMIAVIVLTALFFTVTISATGLLLAFCKKNNSVFSLQKSEEDSHYEMDDLDKTDSESCCGPDDHSDEIGFGKRGGAARSSQHRRSQTYPELSGMDLQAEVASVETQCCNVSSESLDSRTPLMAHVRTSKTLRKTYQNPRETESNSGERSRSSSFKRSVTVAAIHHNAQHAETVSNCGVRIHVEDFDSRSEVSDSAFENLYLKLQEDEEVEKKEEEEEEKEEEEEEEEEGEEERGDSDLDDDDDDAENDQTRALLKC